MANSVREIRCLCAQKLFRSKSPARFLQHTCGNWKLVSSAVTCRPLQSRVHTYIYSRRCILMYSDPWVSESSLKKPPIIAHRQYTLTPPYGRPVQCTSGRICGRFISLLSCPSAIPGYLFCAAKSQLQRLLPMRTRLYCARGRMYNVRKYWENEEKWLLTRNLQR